MVVAARDLELFVLGERAANLLERLAAARSCRDDGAPAELIGTSIFARR